MRGVVTGALALLVTAAVSARAADSGLAFQYTIDLQQGGQTREASFLKGFETADGVRFRVKLNQSSYCYVMVSDGKGGYTLAFPDPAVKKAALPASTEWAKLPKTTLMRVGEAPDVERIYLMVATDRIPEMESAFAAGETRAPESLALGVRNRYLGEGSYNRDLEGNTVSVKYRKKGSAPAVVVEEISLLRR
jgi:hypothetical protein